MISPRDRPFRHPWFRAVPDGAAYLFEYGGSVVRMTGPEAVPLLSALLPLLDGSGTVEEIQRRLPRWDPAVVTQALSVLSTNGVITLVDSAPSCAEDEHLLAALLGGGKGIRSLSDCGLGVVGEGDLAETVLAVSERCGIGRLRRLQWGRDPDEALDLVLAAPADGDLARLEEWNALMLRRVQPWLPVLPFDGVCASVGPLVLPGETACSICLQIRRRSALHDPDLAQRYEAVPAFRPVGSAVASLVAGLAVHLAARWVSRRDPQVVGMLFAVRLRPHPDVQAHEVHPVPRCPACRRRPGHTPAPWHAVPLPGDAGPPPGEVVPPAGDAGLLSEDAASLSAAEREAVS